MASLGAKLRWVRYLKARAVLGKVEHKLNRRVAGSLPRLILGTARAAPVFRPAPGFARSWSAVADRFGDLEGLRDGRFETKGQAVAFGAIEAMDWSPQFSDRPELANWTYDFVSFSYAPALIAQADGVQTLARMVRRLDARHPMERLEFVWTPICVALRIMGLTAAVSIAIAGGAPPHDVNLRAIVDHIETCRRNLNVFAERYLGYNHAAFGLTALCVADAVVNEGRRADRLALEALRSFESQLLADGFQAERTGTYHVHVLLLAQSLLALDYGPEVVRARIGDLVERMRAALDVLVHPDGEIALFNDCAMDDSVPPSAVGWKASEQRSYRVALPDAGFTRLVTPRASVVFDAGKLGPDDVIGHAHADFLSFELSLDGVRLVTDPGVFSYAPGPLRDLTRSAASHNGPGYDGLEPAEFFGAWRVGWRGSGHRIDDASLPGARTHEVAGWCDGYDRFGGRTMRYLGLGEDGVLLVVDIWRAGPGLTPRLRLLAPDGWTAVADGDRDVTLSHTSGVAAAITASAFRTEGPAVSEWRPRGAMIPTTATELLFSPGEVRTDGVHLNILSIAPGGGTAADAEAVAAAVLNGMGARLGLTA